MQVPLNEYDFPTGKVSNVQQELQRLIEKNYYLNQSAKDAFRSYVLAYNSHALKEIFNVHTLDLAAIARSFGFEQPPRVRLPFRTESHTPVHISGWGGSVVISVNEHVPPACRIVQSHVAALRISLRIFFIEASAGTESCPPLHHART